MKLLIFLFVSACYWIEELMEYSVLPLLTWDLSIGKMRVGTLISIFYAFSHIYDALGDFMLIFSTFYILIFSFTYF